MGKAFVVGVTTPAFYFTLFRLNLLVDTLRYLETVASCKLASQGRISGEPRPEYKYFWVLISTSSGLPGLTSRSVGLSLFGSCFTQ